MPRAHAEKYHMFQNHTEIKSLAVAVHHDAVFAGERQCHAGVCSESGRRAHVDHLRFFRSSKGRSAARKVKRFKTTHQSVSDR